MVRFTRLLRASNVGVTGARGVGLGLLALGLVAGAVLAGCSGAHSGAAARPSPSSSTSSHAPVITDTSMRTFSPYLSDGTLAAPADRSKGSCWTSSIAVPVTGVYRCLVANQIYDPCFAPPHETKPATVACFANPWSAGHILALTGPLPGADGTALSDTNPWALQLANGARCVDVTGTVPTVGGVALDYQCGPGKAAGLVAGNGEALRVEYGAAPSGPLTLVPVAAAWRG